MSTRDESTPLANVQRECGCSEEGAAEIVRLRQALFDVAWAVKSETEGYTFGKPSYDSTLDHLHECAEVALDSMYGASDQPGGA